MLPQSRVVCYRLACPPGISTDVIRYFAALLAAATVLNAAAADKPSRARAAKAAIVAPAVDKHGRAGDALWPR